MKNLYLSLIVGLSTVFHLSAQNFEWARQMASSQGNAIAVDASYHVYTTGPFGGTVDFDPGPGMEMITDLGDGDFFIQKLDSAGDFIWAKGIGGTGVDASIAIAIDPGGDIIISGVFEDTVDFDPGPGYYPLVSEGNFDVFVLKLDPSGNFLWAKSWGGIFQDFSWDLSVDDSSNILVIGTFSDTVDFDPGPGVLQKVSRGKRDIFVQKLDGSGNLKWSATMGGPGNETGYTIETDSMGNVYTTGGFEWFADFDPGPAIRNLYAIGTGDDVFIQKMDAGGNYLWAKRIGNGNSDTGYNLAVDQQGNIFVSGSFTTSFQDSLDFDPGPGKYLMYAQGGRDMFLLNLSTNGDFIWARRIGGNNYERPHSIALDKLGNLYTAGVFRDTVDFDPGPGLDLRTSQGEFDIFILKMGPTGNYRSVVTIGGTDYDGVRSLALDNVRNIYYTGYFSGMVDFDPGSDNVVLTSIDVADGFVSKLGQCQDLTVYTITDTACNSYTLNGLTYDSSGIYYQTLDNAAACDSAIILNLTLLKSASRIDTVTDCYGLTLNGQTYDESGIYTQVLTNAAGCDSTITIHLSIHVPYITLVDTACNAYTLNDSTYTSSGFYYQILSDANGCDSIVQLVLTLEKTYGVINASTDCQGYTLNGQTYTETGFYTDTLVNAVGCDSIVELFLTIDTARSTLNITTCDSYTLNNQTYSATGTYQQTVTTPAGCDSIITLNLTIATPTYTFADTACESYTLNNQTYSVSGVYTQMLTTPSGCDSIIQLYLAIFETDTSVTQNDSTLTANYGGFYPSYQWIDCANGYVIVPGATDQSFTVTTSGSYAVILDDGWCVDTSACYFVVLAGIENGFDFVIEVFPNPVVDFLTVKPAQDIYEATVSLVDLTGQEVLSVKVDLLDQIQLNMQQLPQGIYFLKIGAKGKLAVRKIQIIRG